MASSERGLRVVEVPAGGPAQRAGLLVGDYVLAIDGRAVAGVSSQKLHELLSGEVGSEIKLRVDRQGVETEVRIQRAPYGGAH